MLFLCRKVPTMDYMKFMQWREFVNKVMKYWPPEKAAHLRKLKARQRLMEEFHNLMRYHLPVYAPELVATHEQIMTCNERQIADLAQYHRALLAAMPAT